ncbi:uncharacterized protein LOC115178352 [Rhizophagus irregularis DAOM 181602=DAOM 197198]|nr:uncharacterized protein LOC115178352 [Rhizophagus irregularis DAOM 181602=DAOM 197198]
MEDSECSDNSDYEEDNIGHELQSLIDELGFVDPLAVNDYINIDNRASAEEELSLQEIVDVVKGTNEREIEEEEEQDEISTIVVLNSIENVIKYIQQKDLEIEDQIVSVIINTGAAISVITDKLRKKLGISIFGKSKFRCTIANGEKIEALGKAGITIRYKDELEIEKEVEVIDSSEEDLILGNDIWKKLNVSIDFENKEMRIERQEETVIIPISYERGLEELEEFEESELSNDEREYERSLGSEKRETVKMQTREGKFLEKLNIGEVDNNEKDDMIKMLLKYQDILEYDEEKEGRMKIVKHRIEIEKGVKPIKQKRYKETEEKSKVIREEVDKLLKQGKIRKSNSPWSSPVTLAKKKTGKYRFCIDYRQLNKVTIPDSYPLPRIDELLEKYRRAKWFSSIDLAAGFHQIEMDEKDRSKTAFKCKFLERDIEFLGHIVGNGGLRPDEKKIEKVQGIKELTTVKEGEEQQRAFDTLKKKLIKYPILQYPNFEKEFILITDTSGDGIGAILSQKDEKGREIVIAYASRSLQGAEKRYPITELECLAVITDHAALKGLMSAKVPVGRRARWVMELQQYNFEIIHSPGKENKNADALSRLLTMKKEKDGNTCWENYIGRETKKSEKSSYETLKKDEYLDMVKMFEDNQDMYKDTKRYSLVRVKNDDISWKKVYKEIENWRALKDIQEEIVKLRDKNRRLGNIKIEDWNEGEVLSIKEIQEEIIKAEITIGKTGIYKEILWKKGERKLRVIRKYEFEGLMYMMHDNELSGHFGMNATYEKMRERYYWKNMRKDIEEYIRTCWNCQVRGKPSGKSELHPIKIGEPFEVIGIDIVGPLNKTGKGNKYIVVAIDYFTKWAEARALKEATANEVTKFLWEDIICRHGCPRKIISDRGTHFNNKLMEKLTERCGINHRLSTPYHPEINGLVERFNRTLCESLARLRGQDWDRNVSSVLFAYRTKKHKSSNMQPFYVTYSREAKIPLDKDENKIKDVSQKFNESTGDKKHRIKEEFGVEDKVLLYEAWREKQWSGKLQEKWKGPYVIHEKLLNGSYQLRELNGQILKIPQNGKWLKKYRDRLKFEPRILIKGEEVVDRREFRFD